MEVPGCILNAFWSPRTGVAAECSLLSSSVTVELPLEDIFKTGVLLDELSFLDRFAGGCWTSGSFLALPDSTFLFLKLSTSGCWVSCWLSTSGCWVSCWLSTSGCWVSCWLFISCCSVSCWLSTSCCSVSCWLSTSCCSVTCCFIVPQLLTSDQTMKEIRLCYTFIYRYFKLMYNFHFSFLLTTKLSVGTVSYLHW